MSDELGGGGRCTDRYDEAVVFESPTPTTKRLRRCDTAAQERRHAAAEAAALPFSPLVPASSSEILHSGFYLSGENLAPYRSTLLLPSPPPRTQQVRGLTSCDRATRDSSETASPTEKAAAAATTDAHANDGPSALIGGASTASAAAAAWNGTGGGREAVPEAISPEPSADHHRHALPRTPAPRAGSSSARCPAGITIEVPQDAGAFGAGSDDGTLDNEDDDAGHLHQLLLRATRPYCPYTKSFGEGGEALTPPSSGAATEEVAVAAADLAPAAVPIARVVDLEEGRRCSSPSLEPGGGGDDDDDDDENRATGGDEPDSPAGAAVPGTRLEAGEEEEEEPPGTAPAAGIDREEPRRPTRSPCEDTAGKTHQATVGEAVAAPIENAPPAPRRPKVAIRNENREYLESAFGAVALGAAASPDSECGGGQAGGGGGQQQAARECRNCGQVVPHGWGGQDLIQHLVSLPCLCRRVERGSALPIALAKRAIAKYRERNFAPAAPPPGASAALEASASRKNLWTCQHCHKTIQGRSYRPLLLHLSSCVGIVPVMTELEGILLSAVGSSTTSSATTTTRRAGNGDGDGDDDDNIAADTLVAHP
jgi:hypothetical protein